MGKYTTEGKYFGVKCYGVCNKNPSGGCFDQLSIPGYTEKFCNFSGYCCLKNRLPKV